MEERKKSNQEILEEVSNYQNSDTKLKPHVMKNFKKELKRVKWPTQVKQNKKFFYIFVFIIILTGLFALISFGATSIIELIGAK